jgi:hypothetical protein
LRDALADALHRQKLTADIAQRAAAAHARAEQHQQDCQSKVADFTDLDAQTSEAVTAALRDGSNPETAREQFTERVAQRAEAQAALTDAASAVATLLAERSAAAGNASSANQEVNLLAARVLAFAAERIAADIRNLQSEIVQKRLSLLGYDRISGGLRLPLPPGVRTVLGAVDARDAGRANAAPWARALEALRSDPLAAIEIEFAPVAPPVLPTMPPVPVAMPPVEAELPGPQDDGDPGWLPPAA